MNYQHSDVEGCQVVAHEHLYEYDWMLPAEQMIVSLTVTE